MNRNFDLANKSLLGTYSNVSYLIGKGGTIKRTLECIFIPFTSSISLDAPWLVP